ncbi:MAG: aldehyde dehydrogenase [Planctomycetota bacterium]|nr:MAG: aldehyde dehydrogenase [Planctomycetota bacterium]
MSTTSSVSRRAFLSGLIGAGGLLLAAPASGGTLRKLLRPADGESFEPSLWLAIQPDGLVRIVTHRSEMGTGIRTTLPMVLADELGADWERVELSQALGDARFGDQNTDGSRSIRQFYEPMRRAGAAARLMLEQAAAAQWGVPTRDCTARDHAVHHSDGRDALPFGELVAAAAALSVPADDALRFRSPSERRYVGKGVPSYDTADIVRGTARFGLDVPAKGALTAVIARPPVVGASVAALNDDDARDVEGVIDVIQLDTPRGAPGFAPLGGVAVVAGDTWSAMQGRAALEIEWGASPHDAFDSAADRDARLESVRQPGVVVRQKGDVNVAFAEAARRVSAEYSVPYLAHASMEPPCALAIVKDGAAEIWAPTQNPQAAQGMVAGALRIAPDRVSIHVTLLGGGFGRKSKPDFVVEAALLSQRMGGRPVRLVWSREDDIRHDYYHAAAAVAFEAGLDAQGELLALRGRTAFPSISSTFSAGVDQGSSGELAQSFSDLPYNVPALQLEVCKAEAHLRIGWLRSVCNIFHAFAAGCFVDELAHARSQDPVQHLLALLGPDRHVDLLAEGVQYGNYGESLDTHPFDVGRIKNVVRLVAQRSGWGGELPRGRGRGVAVARSFVADAAVVVEVDIAKDGKLRIPRVDIAIDCGTVVNPDRVRAQLEGAVIFGLSLALHGEITAENGAVVQSNVHEFKLLRMSEAPLQIHTHLVESSAPPSGVGEPGVPPVAPALLNAVFAAVGQRVRDLPLARHDLSWT